MKGIKNDDDQERNFTHRHNNIDTEARLNWEIIRELDWGGKAWMEWLMALEIEIKMKKKDKKDDDDNKKKARLNWESIRELEVEKPEWND